MAGQANTPTTSASAGPFRCIEYSWRLLGDADLVEHVSALYRGCASGGSAAHELTIWRTGADAAAVAVDGVPVLEDVHPGHAVAHLAWEVNQRAVASSRPMLHAAAAQVDRHVVLLPGRKGAGKSTLVAGLVRRGLAYVTDETSAVDDHGDVELYAKPISLKEGSWPELPDLADHDAFGAGDSVGQWLVAPDAVRSRSIPPEGGRARWIVFPTYRRGTPTAVKRVTRGQAVVELFGHVLNLDALGVDALSKIAGVVARCDCYEVEYGDLASACASVVRLTEGDDAFAAEQVPGGEPAQPGGRVESFSPAARPTRRIGLQSVELDGEVVVYDRSRRSLHHLNATCATLWQACDGRVCVAEMVESLETTFAHEPDALARDVAKALDELMAAGLVEMGSGA